MPRSFHTLRKAGGITPAEFLHLNWHVGGWTHPSDIPLMNECLREAFVELYSMPLLEDLRDSLEMRFPEIDFPPLPERGTLDIQKVKESQFFFH